MSGVNYQCATCGNKYVSKNKLKKHQKRQNPRHTGFIQVFSSLNDQKTKTTTTDKKTQTAGNRAKGTRKNTFTRIDETIFPKYEDGVIRVLESDWEKIKDLLPEGAKHHLVESTNHHLILFTAEAYAEIDFMMYEMNFCEQEMHYEDLVDALGYYAQEDNIKVLDVCELQTSTITEIDGQIIKCEVGGGREGGMSVAELTASLSGLEGLAIAYGKFKRPARATSTYKKPTWNTPRKTTTPAKKTPTTTTGSTSTKQGGSTLAKPIRSPVVPMSKGQKTLMDFGERDDSSRVYTDDELERIYSEAYTLKKPSRTDDRFDFMAQEGYMGGGYNWRKTSTATASVAPIVAKYHPIYGIKGKKLQVDRYVDLTPLIEADEVEVMGAETKKDCCRMKRLVERKDGTARCRNCGTVEFWKAETLNDWMMLPNSCGNNDCGDGHCPQCGSCRDWADDEDDDGDFMYYCGSCSHKFYVETFEASEGGFKLNVATTPVDEAYAYAKGEFEKRGKRMEDYIPHFYESYESLQESCKTAIDVPRIEMPVIDPEQLNLFQKSLMAGQLDVNRPYAKGRTELYSPKDLFGDTERAMQYLYLGLQDGIITDDVVEAQMVRNSVGLLRPTQSQMWLEKLIRNIIQFGNPQGDGVGAYSQDSMIVDKTLAISSDGYILDGHHRYGQIVLVNPGLRMRTLQINLPIRTLLKVATPYGNAIGNDQRG